MTRDPVVAVGDAVGQARRDAYQRAIEIVDEYVKNDGDRNDAIDRLRTLRDAPSNPAIGSVTP